MSTNSLSSRLALAAGGSGDGKGPGSGDVAAQAESLLWYTSRGGLTSSIARIAAYTRVAELATPEVKAAAYVVKMRQYEAYGVWPAGELLEMERLLGSNDPGFTDAFKSFAGGKSFEDWASGAVSAYPVIRSIVPKQAEPEPGLFS